MTRTFFYLLVALLATRSSPAQQNAESGQSKPDNKQKSDTGASDRFPAPAAEDKTVKTQHTIHVHGQDLHYTATAGTLVLKSNDGNGKPKASMFFVAYTLDGADLAKRALTFAFNGGPGSSSVWLHMGALGPKRVALTPEGEAVAPPYRLVDNEETALSTTDLVFIDPVSTGFSRNAPGEDPKQFHGLEEDLDSVSDFIRLYMSRFERWSSPKFLAGESYGTTRAAGLSEYLIRKHGIYLNGITLISSVLNFGTLSFDKGNDMPYALYLPTYTATAWYHKKLGSELQGLKLDEVVQQARRFASTTYLQALMKGDALNEAERRELMEQVAKFTGLSSRFIDDANGRISDERFFKELMRDQKKVVGRYDSRLLGSDVDAAAERAEYDPSYAAVQGAFTAAFNEYVRKELNWQTDLPYEVLTNKVQPWDFSHFINEYVNVSSRLHLAMVQNPYMQVLQMNGYYDLATPFFATEYTFDHLGLPAKIRSNISMSYCGAGHMLYLRQSCRETLSTSMAGMYRTALAQH